jgi:hypothetical protein
MFPTNLTTNEVKNASGTEIEFLRQSVTGRETVFAKSGEAPNLLHRIAIRHAEIGSGFKLRRRSQLRVELQHTSDVDNETTVSSLFYVVGDLPVGAIAVYTNPKLALANLISLLASTGADTTIKFDCTGYGADALINGTM